MYEPVGKMTLDQVPETEPKGAALTQTVNNVADGSGAESSARSTDRSITMEITVTEDALSHHVSSSERVWTKKELMSHEEFEFDDSWQGDQ